MPGTKKTNVAAAGFARYSAAKGGQFRLALPQDDSNDSDDRRQYSGQVLFQRYTAQTRDTEESIEQSIDNNVENGASRIHPNLSEYIRITCLLFSPAILLSFSTTTQTETSACKPNEKLFRPLGSS